MTDYDVEATISYIDERVIELERIVDDLLERVTKLEDNG